MKLISGLLASFLAILLQFSFSEVAGAQRIYTVGVVPQFETRRLVEIWQPILDQVSKETNLRLVLKSSPSIPEFEKQFSRGEFDIAYMNPYHLIVANKKQGYRPIVRDIGKRLYGIVVVKKESDIKSVKDLNGKKVAFPAPNALGAALMPRAEFSTRYHIDVEEVYAKSHSSVYLNVVLGLVDAGGGVQKTLAQQPEEIRDQLRILYKTVKVSPHPIAVHKRVSKEVRARLTQAFLELGRSKEGRKKLARIPIKQIGKTTMKDYSSLRTMGLDRFYVE